MTKTLTFYSRPVAVAAVALTLIALVLPKAGQPLPQGTPQESLAPGSHHEHISRLVTTLFERSHYRRSRVDDALSSKIFDRYLEVLDGNKSYFLASDVAEFEAHRYALDDSVKRGKLQVVFDMFDRYRTRLRERVAVARRWLEVEPDFTVDEDYTFDRRDEPWARNTEELDELWRRRVKNDLLSLALTGKTGEEAVEVLSKRYDQMLTRTDQLNADEVFESFMNAYADTLDPHSNYFSPRNSEEYRIQMSLSYDGIGASLKLEDEYVTVLDIIPGGPAHIDGQLERLDRITAVGQGEGAELIDVVGWRLDDVVQLIRGPGGTNVRLKILPGGAAPGAAEHVVELTRDKVKLEAQAAQSEVLEIDRAGTPVKIGVIDIPSFYQDFQARSAGDKDYTSTTSDVRRLIGELSEQGIDALVVDLRGNGGGHLSEATALTGLFIDNGPLVQLRDSSGRVEILRDNDKGVAYDGPLAVLVDRYSASASEIFAGAIQDYGRGLVIGQRTYGKGSVQNLYDLNRYASPTAGTGYGQLTVTIGKYYRVTGASTQHRGVNPDIALPTHVDLAEVGESARKTALPWDEIKATRYQRAGSVGEWVNPLTTSHSRRTADDPDFNYWLDTIADFEARRDETTVSLNLEERKAERERARIKRLELENERRVAQGLDPLATPEELDEIDPVDVLLHETAEIVADMVSGTIVASTTPEKDSLPN